MTFRRYDHLERQGHPDVDGIEIGTVYVFPKLDGTNASVWNNNGHICAGSRNRELSVNADNAGFCAWVHSDDPRAIAVRTFVLQFPNLIVYGEWLVPHTLKTYREDAWRRFYVFDVWHRGTGEYLSWSEWAPTAMDCGLDVVEPLCTITNPSAEQLQAQLETNTYLIEDGAGLGEGVVIKNYRWRNKHGSQPWMKIVRNEFKEQSKRAFGTTEKTGEFQVEAAIADEFVTPTLVGKTKAKVLLNVWNAVSDGEKFDAEAQNIVQHQHRGRVIPQLLGRVFSDLVTEEMWAILKKHKNPVVDFKRLQQHVVRRVKELCPEMF